MQQWCLQLESLYKKGHVTFIQRAEGETEAKELRRELSNTYVALSEIYMTDLCDNEEAETESRRYIQVPYRPIYFIPI
jgi:hypothetical protein